MTTDEIIGKVRLRAENCFAAKKICCSEAVFLVMNEAFGGGLGEEMCLRLSSGFCHGMGGAASVCGAVSGAAMAMGLFLGPYTSDGLKKKPFRSIVKEMQGDFEKMSGSLTCNVLLDKAKQEKKAGKDFCRDMTGLGAELAARAVLAMRPELVGAVNLGFLDTRDSAMGAILKKVFKS